MKITEASCVINALGITEITIKNFPDTGLLMDAVYALAAAQAVGSNAKDRRILGTHGRCQAYTSNWSKETKSKLEELIASMEQDLLPRHFNVTADEREDSDGTGIETRGHKEVNQI